MTTGLFFQCVCLVYQWQCQFAAAAGDDDDDDDKVANDAVTVCLVLEISRMLVLAVTDARVCCPVFTAYCICCSHDLGYLATRSVL